MGLAQSVKGVDVVPARMSMYKIITNSGWDFTGSTDGGSSGAAMLYSPEWGWSSSNALVKTAMQWSSPAYDAAVERYGPSGELAPQVAPNRAVVIVIALGSGEYYGCNKNGDYFPEKELISSYKTFLDGHVFRHHVNKDPRKSIGDIVGAFWNSQMHRVELLIELDHSKAGREIRRSFGDGFVSHPFSVSMGCKVPYDVCSICGKKTYKPSDYCEHIKRWRSRFAPDGRRAYMININPKFFDISVVIRPADETAYILKKVAEEDEEIVSRIDVPTHVSNEDIREPAINTLRIILPRIGARSLMPHEIWNIAQPLIAVKRDTGLSPGRILLGSIRSMVDHDLLPSTGEVCCLGDAIANERPPSPDHYIPMIMGAERSARMLTLATAKTGEPPKILTIIANGCGCDDSGVDQVIHNIIREKISDLFDNLPGRRISSLLHDLIGLPPSHAIVKTSAPVPMPNMTNPYGENAHPRYSESVLGGDHRSPMSYKTVADRYADERRTDTGLAGAAMLTATGLGAYKLMGGNLLYTRGKLDKGVVERAFVNTPEGPQVLGRASSIKKNIEEKGMDWARKKFNLTPEMSNIQYGHFKKDSPGLLSRMFMGKKTQYEHIAPEAVEKMKGKFRFAGPMAKTLALGSLLAYMGYKHFSKPDRMPEGEDPQEKISCILLDIDDALTEDLIER